MMYIHIASIFFPNVEEIRLYSRLLVFFSLRPSQNDVHEHHRNHAEALEL
jgi:hypothetical protein